MSQRTKCVSLRKSEFSGSTIGPMDYETEINLILKANEAEGYEFINCTNEGEFVLLFFYKPQDQMQIRPDLLVPEPEEE